MRNTAFILFALVYSNFSFTQNLNEKVIVNSLLKDIDSIIVLSNYSIISKIGEENFNHWLDSIIVVEIPYDNGCQGVHRPCDPIPPMLSDNERKRITYHFTVPVFGYYSGSNYTYRDADGKTVLEDQYIFPDCMNHPYKCTFQNIDSLLYKVKKLLSITDTSEFRLSRPCFYSGSFAYLFETGKHTLILSANTGKVLKYAYFGSFSSNDCSVVQKCTLNDAWVENAKNFLEINDEFTLISESPSENAGRICKWRFSSDTSYLELNGKDGILMNYINYMSSTDE